MNEKIDDHGFQINITELPTYSEYCRSARKYHGVSPLGQVWAQRLRPLLTPSIDELIRLDACLAKTKHERAFLAEKIALNNVEIARCEARLVKVRAECSAPP